MNNRHDNFASFGGAGVLSRLSNYATQSEYSNPYEVNSGMHDVFSGIAAGVVPRSATIELFLSFPCTCLRSNIGYDGHRCTMFGNSRQNSCITHCSTVTAVKPIPSRSPGAGERVGAVIQSV